jgi:hypothetical protein
MRDTLHNFRAADAQRSALDSGMLILGRQLAIRASIGFSLYPYGWPPFAHVWRLRQPLA